MIRRLEVRNFKSLRDISVSLGPRNVLVGPNMSGKSNLISVFRFLRQMVTPSSGVLGLPNAVLASGGFEELRWRGGDSNLVSIALAGDMRAADPSGAPADWEYRLDFVGGRGGALTIQDETLRLLAPQASTTLIARDPGSGRRVLRNRAGAAVSEVSDNSRSALEFEIPDWEGNELRQFLASIRFYHLIPQAMKQVNAATGATVLDEHGGNLSAWLMMLQTRHAEETFAKINSVARDLLPELASVLTWPTQQSTVFVASTERFLKTPVPLWHMSDGELCFLALLSLIFAPTELGAPLYCVEEPENYLHPRLLTALMELQRQRQEELGEKAAQVIVATHSLHLVDSAHLEDLIVLERRAGSTICTKPSEKGELRALISREDVGLGDLYYSGALGSG